MADVPGGSSKDCFVLSESNTLQYLTMLNATSNAEYTCDGWSLRYKSISTCSHSTAAAHSNGKLKKFFRWFGEKRRGQETNQFQIAKHGMPLGAEKKGGTNQDDDPKQPVLYYYSNR